MNSGSTLYSVGYNSWDGNVVLNGDALFVVDTFANNETLDINGVISGSGGVTLTLGGTLRFGGSFPNTYTGTTTILGSTNWNTVSTLELRKTNSVAVPGRLVIGSVTNPPGHEIVRLFSQEQIANLTPVTVNLSGLLDLNNQTETIGSLEGIGQVKLGNSTLRAGGNNADTTYGGTLAGPAENAPHYRLFALDTTPPKPGLVRVTPDCTVISHPGSSASAPGPAPLAPHPRTASFPLPAEAGERAVSPARYKESASEKGASIAGELWRLPAAGFARFMAGLTAPMAIGRVWLADGRDVLGFLCEPAAIQGAADITRYGGWRAWREAR